VSCKSSYKLTTSEKAFNPYAAGDILVFKANTGETDTVFILEIERMKGPIDQLAIFPDKAEHLNVFVRHSDPSPPRGIQRYLENNFLEIHKWNRQTATVDFDFSASSAWFYGGNGLNMTDFLNSQKHELTIGSVKYTDIVVLNSGNTEYRERNNFISKIYWSISKGYVKFDLFNGKTWELIGKYGR